MTQQIFMTADGLAEHLMSNVRRQAIWTPMTSMDGNTLHEIRAYFNTAHAAAQSQLEKDQYGQPVTHLDIDLVHSPGNEFSRTKAAVEKAAQNTRFR